ncbi:ATP-binding protein [Limnofasciculus baicalensis]|uniref:Circadian input-output histidine kinase CikA n=1 Tax=Limnofasciculus baicalensis BBK-W-15 TaxID=2699891 RepID=A0AAE3KUD6_9CYAN|nr:ATP-binding protein [Limnofasciculus baicalensis]MCP2731402.1 ATP-binding protein [Limnofasciculus baicalensis BBK-W-15]
MLLSSLLHHTAPTAAESLSISESSPIAEIVRGWEYRWGDSPLDASGIPIFTHQANSNSEWQPFQFPHKIEKPLGVNTKILWLRVPLPGKQLQSPTLYLGGVPYILDVYLENRLLYTQLSLNRAGEANLVDYQWPIVSLEPDFQNKNLFFRVYVGGNAGIYIGLFERIILGEQVRIIQLFFQQKIDTLLGVMFIFLGSISLISCLGKQKEKSYFYFGLLAITIGLYAVAPSALIRLFFKDFAILNFVEFTSFYLIPVSFCLFFEEMFGAGYRSIIRRLWQIHLLFAGVALLSITTGRISWSQTVTPAQILLLISASVVLFRAIKISLKGNSDAKLFTSGFIILTLSGINDVLIYQMSWVYWYHKMYPWGTLIFILILGFILESRFTESQQLLQAYALELESKNATLQKLDQLKDEFLANTSHELKTPLNGIIGIAESLVDGATGKLSKQTVFNLSLIVSSGKRLHQLVNDLLDFSKLKHQKIELKLQPVGIREITEVVLTLSRPLIKSKPVALINKIAADIPPVNADENRVQQILYNLVGNGIKFTERGTVEVSAEVVNDWVQITVTDTGIGIPSNKFERIFESFEQADGSIAREYGGTGLGLAVTKQLVELHGGNILVESTVGLGSRFTFSLPVSESQIERKLLEEISQVQESPEITVTDDNILINSEGSVSLDGAFQILIVDDEPVNLQVIVNHLSLHNYAITQASNGIEALEIIDSGFKPDLILLDVMMPRMTGYELCQKIREQFLQNELPVVLLTAKNQVSDLVEGFAAGANDYLTKPILKNELLARIKTHLRLAKINAAYERFVPQEFLKFLARESIIDVQLGDQVQREMTVLFSDIRSFTSLSERMSPKENFDFINAYLSHVSPVIRHYRGFIDKYIGDAVMALFPQTADDAVQGAIEMQKQVSLYNQERQNMGEVPIAIGIGLHTGSLMLGTVGESQRMETTVISDAVNLASRLEGLTKVYGVDILISEETLYRLDNPEIYAYRYLDRVTVKGKSQPIAIFEVYDSNSPYLIEIKRQTRGEFERGVALYVAKKFSDALVFFDRVWQINKQDLVVELYIERCKEASRI